MGGLDVELKERDRKLRCLSGRMKKQRSFWNRHQRMKSKVSPISNNVIYNDIGQDAVSEGPEEGTLIFIKLPISHLRVETYLKFI
jgi:hypothetical protein